MRIENKIITKFLNSQELTKDEIKELKRCYKLKYELLKEFVNNFNFSKGMPALKEFQEKFEKKTRPLKAIAEILSYYGEF